jgi:hypothetical protein
MVLANKKNNMNSKGFILVEFLVTLFVLITFVFVSFLMFSHLPLKTYLNHTIYEYHYCLSAKVNKTQCEVHFRKTIESLFKIKIKKILINEDSLTLKYKHYLYKNEKTIHVQIN